MKKGLLLLLVLMLLPIAVSAHDFEVDGIFYNIDGEEATVTFKGLYSYEFSDEYSGDIVVPDRVTYNGATYVVTAIGDSAFHNCQELTSIDIQNSVITISGHAFEFCFGLTRIEIPNSVTTIGDFAFDFCTGLTNIEIPNSVITIGNCVFWACSELTNVTLGNSLTAISDHAFDNCSNLTSVNIPNSVTSIGNFAFNNCTALTSIDIPNSVTTIGYQAFSECTRLTNINIPNSVITIGEYAFFCCTSLSRIDIPSSVMTIGRGAFTWCPGLTNIYVESGNANYDSRDNCNAIIETSSNTLIAGCCNTSIPNSVTTIGGGAFGGCTGLTSIDIPNSVTTIGGSAFSGCTGLTSIDIPNSVTTIGGSAFSGCTGLTSIDIPNSVTSIGGGAFNGTAWQNNQPDGLVYAGLFAYEYKGTMPDGTGIILKDGTIGIAGSAFYRCTGLTSIDIPNSVITIGESAFYECNGLTSINIPNSVITIGESAFNRCTGLTSIDIPNSVMTIGQFAFYGCNGLTRIDIGNSVATIGDRAFCSFSTGLTDVFCYATNPPSCLSNPFSPYSPTLHVPASSFAAYFTAPFWSNFENIMGDAVIPTAISITKDSVDIQLAEQINLTAIVSPANASNKVVNWHSTNKNIATVDDGIVTAVGIGECDIIATCFGMNDTCHVAVGNQLKLDQQEALLLPNHMLILTPTAAVLPNGFTATSSEPTVAAVRVMNGKVQVVGIKEGLTTITVSAADGIATPATCLVTVYTKPGDMNSDGFLTITDMTSLIDYLMGGDPSSVTIKNADVNGDGKISITDVTSMIDALLSGEE